MEIEFFDAREVENKLKCTIHRTGKLGFTEQTIIKLGISENKRVKIGTSKSNGENKDIILMIVDRTDESAFKINKAGKYFYVNTAVLFDKIGIDYKTKTIMFDMIEHEIETGVVYKLIKREGKKKQ